jgi:hypothetical protein
MISIQVWTQIILTLCITISIYDVKGTSLARVELVNESSGVIVNMLYDKNKTWEHYPEIEKQVIKMHSECAKYKHNLDPNL